MFLHSRYGKLTLYEPISRILFQKISNHPIKMPRSLLNFKKINSISNQDDKIVNASGIFRKSWPHACSRASSKAIFICCWWWSCSSKCLKLKWKHLLKGKHKLQWKASLECNEWSVINQGSCFACRPCFIIYKHNMFIGCTLCKCELFYVGFYLNGT